MALFKRRVPILNPQQPIRIHLMVLWQLLPLKMNAKKITFKIRLRPTSAHLTLLTPYTVYHPLLSLDQGVLQQLWPTPPWLSRALHGAIRLWWGGCLLAGDNVYISSRFYCFLQSGDQPNNIIHLPNSTSGFSKPLSGIYRGEWWLMR